MSDPIKYDEDKNFVRPGRDQTISRENSDTSLNILKGNISILSYKCSSSIYSINDIYNILRRHRGKGGC